jgi:hypothetical protein
MKVDTPKNPVTETPASGRRKMVIVQGVHKQFGRLEVLKGIDLKMMWAKWLYYGPSGRGRPPPAVSTSGGISGWPYLH